MLVEIKGTVYKFGEVTTNANGQYPKRELVIFQENGDYPDYINIEVQERVFEAFAQVTKDSEVNVTINFGGRLWTNPEGVEKCFNSCRAWKVEVLGAANNSQAEDMPPPF